MKAKCKRYPNRAAWLRARHKGIGASDTPQILGLVKWGSAFSVFQDKTHPPIILDDTPPMRWGRNLEKEIAKEAARIHDLELFNPGTYAIHYHPLYPWMTASLDRTWEYRGWHGRPGVLECKNVTQWKASDWEVDPPLAYRVQVQHQLAVTGYRWGILAALIGGNDLRTFEIERNDALIEGLIRKLKAFWWLVEHRVPPPVDSSQATAEALAFAYPVDTGETVELSEEIAKASRGLERIGKRIKCWEKRATAHSNTLKAAIGDALYGRLPNGDLIPLRTQSRTGHIETPAEYAFDHAAALQAVGIPWEMKGGSVYRVLGKRKKGDRENA